MITQQDRDKARETLARWDEQQRALEKEKNEREADKLRALIAELFDVETLYSWALVKWEAQKKAGIGRGMTEVEAVRYYLEGLKRSLADVCQAFQIDPTLFAGTKS